jgi:hypothetical protein
LLCQIIVYWYATWGVSVHVRRSVPQGPCEVLRYATYAVMLLSAVLWFLLVY